MWNYITLSIWYCFFNCLRVFDLFSSSVWALSLWPILIKPRLRHAFLFVHTFFTTKVLVLNFVLYMWECITTTEDIQMVLFYLLRLDSTIDVNKGWFFLLAESITVVEKSVLLLHHSHTLLNERLAELKNLSQPFSVMEHKLSACFIVTWWFCKTSFLYLI